MKANTMTPVSIIVPTLNEAENLPLLFSRIYDALHAARIPFEIIIVDDNSTDATAAIARTADPKYRVRLIEKKGRLGKAYSLEEGFTEAKYDLICMIDADLQYPPEAITRMYHKLVYCNADIVITKRLDHQTTRFRKLASSVFHLVFTRILFGIDYDTQSGLKLFKKRVLQDLRIAPSPWTFDLEFVVRSLERKYVILSEDISFAKRHAGVPKINMINATLEMAWQSMKLRRSVAKKRVRLQYRQLKPLQQSFNWLMICTLGVFLFGLVQVRPAAAYELPSLQSIVQSLIPKKSDSNPPKAQPATPAVTPEANTTAPATPAVASSSTTDQSAPSTTQQLVTTTTPKTVAAANTAPSTSKSTGPSNTTTDTTPARQSDAGQSSDKYYNTSGLSRDKTSQWLTVASRILLIGMSVLAAGLLLLAIRKFVRKSERSDISRHTYRTNHNHPEHMTR